jgi:hypothetical protein
MHKTQVFEGYVVYKRLDKSQGRYMALLYHPTTKHRTTMSWARYLMTEHLGRFLHKHLETVDHINGDKLDDSLDNLQLLTRGDNARKSHLGSRTLVVLICPICGVQFSRRQGQTHLIKGGRPTCCSRRCGGIRSHQ